jgi:hypothetical protein
MCWATLFDEYLVLGTCFIPIKDGEEFFVEMSRT